MGNHGAPLDRGKRVVDCKTNFAESLLVDRRLRGEQPRLRTMPIIYEVLLVKVQIS